MTRTLRFAGGLAFVLIGALLLSGCGRKGPLDPPPGASLAGEPQPDLPTLLSSKTSTAPAATAPTPKKHIFLDPLLN